MERGFKDIRGGEGEPIEVEGMDEIIVSYDDEFLVDGEYYSFNWTVPSGTTKIKVVGKVEPIDKDKFLDTLFNFHLNTRGGMLQLAINSQESTLEEVTGSSHTFLYELLQNANDYPFKKELVTIFSSFTLAQSLVLGISQHFVQFVKVRKERIPKLSVTRALALRQFSLKTNMSF